MAVWNSSSLAFSDHNNSRHASSGLLKNTKERLSKQHLVEHKMFGSRRGKTGKDFKIGKKFRKVGKGIMKGPTSAHMNKKEGGISPSVDEFDKWMSQNTGNRKKGFSRKSFG